MLRISPSKLPLSAACPGWARLAKTLTHKTDEESAAAKRGILLHRIVTNTISHHPNKDEQALAEVKEPGDIVAAQWCIDAARGYINEYPQSITVHEYQVDLSDLGMPLIDFERNRIDTLIVVPNEGCVVIDYKFGYAYSPPPEYSLQFQAYAWGALNTHGGEWVRCIKLQPEADPEYRITEHTYSAETLRSDVGPRIQSIVEECCTEAAPLVRGPHCTNLFCPCVEVCPEHKKSLSAMGGSNLRIKDYLNQLEPQKRGELFEEMKVAQLWLKKAIARVQEYAVEGGEVGGHEVRPGRSTRGWVDADLAAVELREQALKRGVNPDHMIIPASPISPAEAEKRLGEGRDVKKALAPHILTIDGKPTLKRVRKDG